MKPSRHVIVSLTLGVILWFFTKSVYAGLLCFASGVFVDLDHAIEFIIHHTVRNFTVKSMLEACEQTEKQEGELKFNRLYLVFHTAELALLFWALTIFTKNIYLLAIALGYSLHLIMDYIGNPMYLSSYFLTGRFMKKFSVEKLFRKLG